MKLQLNPTFETFFLLIEPGLGKKQKKEAIKQLDDFGINGAAFYAANFPLIELYCNAFASKMTDTGTIALMKDICEEMIVILAIVLVSHPEWLNDFAAALDAEVSAAVSEVVAGFLGREEVDDLHDELEMSDLSDRAKWQVSALVQQPKQRLMPLIEAINANIPAFEHAYAHIEKDIDTKLAQYEYKLENHELPPVVYQSLSLAPNIEFIPTLASPLILLAFDEYCFCGLLITKVFAGQDEALTDTEATLIAKSLSDASKLEILRVLKGGKHYNLEIARKLELTPATTSHHMNMLLSAGLVEVSEEGRKVYYSLCANGIERYRAWLEHTLLQGDE